MAEVKAQFIEKLQGLFEPHPYKVLYGGRDGCKCLALGTRVVMFDGSLRAVEDVHVGECLMGPDSRPRRVLEMHRGSGPLFRVRQEGAQDYVVNENHILAVKKCRSTHDKQKQPSGKLKFPKGRYPSWPDKLNIGVTLFAQQSKRWQYNFVGYKAGLVEFPHQEVGIDPYLLGVWLGDGTGREMRITNMDEEIIQYCRGIAESYGGRISLYQKAGQKAYDIGFVLPKEGRKSPLWQQFLRYDLKNNKHIPAEYLRNSEEVRLQVLAGLLDTDGMLREGAGRGFSITQVNEKLIRQIKYLADLLGFKTSLCQRKTVCNGVRGMAWNLSINGDLERIPCKLPRKQAKPWRGCHLLTSRLKVEPIGEGEWAGFSLDGDHLFLLEDGTVTHNSWSIARALLILGTQKPLRILCARETMDSIRESVHQLLTDQIVALGLENFYTPLQSEVRGKNGTEFVFAGLRKQTVSSIKSYEAIDICWIEEASVVSRRSLTILLPTIRKPGSEIWFSLNPDLETDAVYQDFVLDPPAGTFLCKTSYLDNLWLSAESRQKIETLRAKDPDTFHHVYEGATRSTVEGAIYKEQIRQCENEGRIRMIPHDQTLAVDTFWDLGFGDQVSIWAAQRVPFEIRILKYFGDSHQPISYFIKEIQSWGYTLGTCYLPWDGATKELGTGKSIEDVMRLSGLKVQVARRLEVHQGINAVREMFPKLWFDIKGCADGLQLLRRYQWGPETALGVSRREPLHDMASHPADALRTMAVGIKDGTSKKPAPTPPRSGGKKVAFL